MRTRGLFRNGSRLKVRGHPVDVLAILLEHPGELVTRDTLQKGIRPEDTPLLLRDVGNYDIYALTFEER